MATKAYGALKQALGFDNNNNKENDTTKKQQNEKKSTCPHRTATTETSPINTTTTTTTTTDTRPPSSAPATSTTDITEQVGPCPECQSEKRARRKYRTKIILGLVLPYALQALDTTIIASSLPTIARRFSAQHQLSWIVTAFNLTSGTFIPLFAQLADILGRHAALQLSLFAVLIGSAICTGCPESCFPLLLLGRAVQGVGCSGVGVVVQVILADKVSLEEKARNWTVFSLVGGLGYAVGPIVGGYLAEVHWRWCFAVNLPVGVAAVPVVWFVLRGELLGAREIPEVEGGEGGESGGGSGEGGGGGGQEARKGKRATLVKRLSTIDVGGQVLFLVGFGLLILALTWGGGTFDWNTAAVLAPLVLGVLVSGGFLFWEYLMAPGRRLARKLPFQKPMIPWELCQNRNIGLLFYINFAAGMALYSVLYFVEIYFSMVEHLPPSEAGKLILYYTPGLGAGVYLSMFMCNSWPKQTFHPLLLGSVVEAVGVGMIAYGLYYQKDSVIFGMIALAGAGTGLRFMPGTLHSVGFFPQHVATVVALMDLATTFGGTLGMTIMQVVLNNTSGIPRDSPYWNSSSDITSLSANLMAMITEKAKRGITWSFVAITPFMVLCVVMAACLGNVYITKETQDEHTTGEARGKHLTHGSYLLALITGRPLTGEQRLDQGHEMQRIDSVEAMVAPGIQVRQ